jgi:predicted LPLAT superfamily acyltransferase
MGRRRYRLLTCPPIEVRRTSRDRDDDLKNAINEWSARLEDVIGHGWFQWFAFDPFSPELAG